MKKIFALSLLAAASLSVAACSKHDTAANTEVANDSMAVDTNTTVNETISDINATAENATTTTGAILDNVAGAANESNASNAM